MTLSCNYSILAAESSSWSVHQSERSSPHHPSSLTVDRVTKPPAPVRLPQTASPAPELVRLPAHQPTTDPRLLSSGTSSNRGAAGQSHESTWRRYPSTQPIVTPQRAREVVTPITYRWDSYDVNLLAAASRIEKQIEVGFKLANKGALYGARAEFRKAILAIAEALDARYGSTGHSQAFHDALQAMKEAADFASDTTGGSGRVARIVATHQTPVLSQMPVTGVPALIAMQRYYSFAQQRLVASSGGAPVASNAMYAMGKLHMALADAENHDNQEAAKAMTFFQAALMVNSSNFAAANELGVMLVRLGHLREAREVLQHSARVRPMQETWKNLETVHHRLGEFPLAQQARLQWQRQPTSTPPAIAGNTGMVHWVSPEAFAGGPSGGIPQTVVPPLTAEKPPGFSLWPWQ